MSTTMTIIPNGRGQHQLHLKADHEHHEQEIEQRQLNGITTTTTTTTNNNTINGFTATSKDRHKKAHKGQNGSLKRAAQEHTAAAAATTTTTTSSGTAKTDQHIDDDDYLLPLVDERPAPEKQTEEFKAQLVWFNIFLFVVLHSCLPVAGYLLYTQRPWKTLAWSVFGMYLSGLGVTGGSHRLWSHRAYKARWPVEVLLMLLQTMAGQNSIYTWSRDHRVHHKFAETDADPHNIKRGFFFAHMGWLCCRKHPDVKTKGALMDMSDLEANPVVMFQHRHFWWLSVVCNVYLPTMVPVWFWQESFWTSFVFSFMVRYLITLHGTWLVNSAAHYYGTRPYDKGIEARESPVVIYTALGEGFHNYHHTFPYDYATSEFGKYLNITTGFIDACAALGLVYERKKVNEETILRRRLRTGEINETHEHDDHYRHHHSTSSADHLDLVKNKLLLF